MNERFRRYLLVPMVLFALAGCRGCAPNPTPPDRVTEERLSDPYGALPPRGTTPDPERAAQVIDLVSEHFGYGKGPGALVRRYGRDPWMKTPALLIAYGQLPQVKAAWTLISEAIVKNVALANETRFAAKTAQARILDSENTHEDDVFMKKAYLSEIAWCLYLIRDLGHDAGKP
jgi:hypothetical protein